MSADDYAKTRKLIEELEVRQIPRWIHSPGDTPRLSGYRHDPLCLGAAQALRALLDERKAMQAKIGAAKDVHQFSEHLHGRNDALMLALSDMTAAMVRMVAGIDHLAEIARQWEPDHSTGEERAKWVRALDARDDAMKLMKELPQRISLTTTADNQEPPKGQ